MEAHEQITIGKVKYLRDTGEYKVPVFVDGKYDENRTYYASDKEDAESTRKAMQAERHRTTMTTSRCAKCDEFTSECYCAEQGDVGEWCLRHDLPHIPNESTCRECESEDDARIDHCERKQGRS